MSDLMPRLLLLIFPAGLLLLLGGYASSVFRLYVSGRQKRLVYSDLLCLIVNSALFADAGGSTIPFIIGAMAVCAAVVANESYARKLPYRHLSWLAFLYPLGWLLASIGAGYVASF